MVLMVTFKVAIFLKTTKSTHMSPRETIQNELVEFLEKNSTRFNAPYGVLASLDSASRGKVRRITFGISRYMDATISIWSEKRIDIEARGPLADKYQGTYSSLAEVIEALSKYGFAVE